MTELYLGILMGIFVSQYIFPILNIGLGILQVKYNRFFDGQKAENNKQTAIGFEMPENIDITE